LEEWLKENEVKMLEDCKRWKASIPVLRSGVIGIKTLPGRGCTTIGRHSCGDLSAQYTPSIILYGKKWSILCPQRRGSFHSGEGKNSILRHIVRE